MLRKSRFAVIIFFVAAVILFELNKFQDRNANDRMPPVITMEEDTVVISVSDDKDAILDGITARDGTDGDVTANLVVEKLGNFIEPGRRQATIAAFDRDSNVSRVTRTVVYSDYEPPMIYIYAPLKFTVSNGSNTLSLEKIISEISAYDSIAGDITNRIRISSDYPINVYKTGEYPTELSVMGEAGASTKIPVTVEIVDPEEERGLPEIGVDQVLLNTPVGNEVSPHSVITYVTVDSVTYELGEDGKLHGKQRISGTLTDVEMELTDVAVSGDVDYDTPGVYEMILSIKNADGNTGKTRIYIHVY